MALVEVVSIVVNGADAIFDIPVPKMNGATPKAAIIHCIFPSVDTSLDTFDPEVTACMGIVDHFGFEASASYAMDEGVASASRATWHRSSDTMAIERITTSGAILQQYTASLIAGNVRLTRNISNNDDFHCVVQVIGGDDVQARVKPQIYSNSLSEINIGFYPNFAFVVSALDTTAPPEHNQHSYHGFGAIVDMREHSGPNEQFSYSTVSENTVGTATDVVRFAGFTHFLSRLSTGSSSMSELIHSSFSLDDGGTHTWTETVSIYFSALYIRFESRDVDLQQEVMPNDLLKTGMDGDTFGASTVWALNADRQSAWDTNNSDEFQTGGWNYWWSNKNGPQFSMSWSDESGTPTSASGTYVTDSIPLGYLGFEGVIDREGSLDFDAFNNLDLTLSYLNTGTSENKMALLYMGTEPSGSDLRHGSLDVSKVYHGADEVTVAYHGAYELDIVPGDTKVYSAVPPVAADYTAGPSTTAILDYTPGTDSLRVEYTGTGDIATMDLSYDLTIGENYRIEVRTGNTSSASNKCLWAVTVGGVDIDSVIVEEYTYWSLEFTATATDWNFRMWSLLYVSGAPDFQQIESIEIWKIS
jgi:hypothetical protein